MKRFRKIGRERSNTHRYGIMVTHNLLLNVDLQSARNCFHVRIFHLFDSNYDWMDLLSRVFGHVAKIFHFFYFVLYYDWFPIASFCFHKLLYRAVRYRSARHNIHVSISIAGRPIINFNSSCTRTCVERTYLLHHLTLFNYAILLWIKEICKPLNVQNFLSYVFTSVSIWQIRQTDTNILDQYQECLYSFHFPFLR